MVNFNGDLISSNAFFLNHQNRGLRYGDALFETMRASEANIYFWEDHYFRLMASMRMLRMEIPMNFTLEFLEEQIKQTLKANGLENSNARIRFTVFRKEGGNYLPKQNEISYVVEVSPLLSDRYELKQEPYEIELFKDYFIAPGLLSGLKTANKLINVLGSIYARENGYQDCLLLNSGKQVVEGLQGNLFVVQGNRIKTPPLAEGCLNGIMRKQILEVLRNNTIYEVEEGSVSPFELQKADELFLTNVIVGLQPVTKYRKASFGHDVASQLTDVLNQSVEKS